MRIYICFIFICLFQNSPASSQHLVAGSSGKAQKVALSPSIPKAKIQIVFALDATGSMQGLIAAAKDKIWSIASSITQTKPTPELELGLIFYRDRNDDFITMRVPLTDSIDKVYSELMSITARGGGDAPESVNLALFEAITKFQWDPSEKVYKTIFLIGDAPPHMDYRNDVQYPESCLLAKSKDINVNTIQMGNNEETEKVWKLIAACHEGGYVKADMKVNDIRITTPYDAEIARINDSLESMHYYYGSAHVKKEGYKFRQLGSNIKSLSASHVQAQRAEYKLNELAKRSATPVKTNDFLEDISNKVVDYATLKEEELPGEMKGMTATQQQAFIKLKLAERTELRKRLTDKIDSRNQYINHELKKMGTDVVNNSFSNILFENIRTQAAKKEIHITGKAKF